MDSSTLDPYEQQLFAVFQSCDDTNEDTLNCQGLTELCDKLQLGEHAEELISCLVGESLHQRIGFQEFREALLKLLNGNVSEEGNGGKSPAREVSPKYVCGKKKYGRRSRPESGEIEEEFDESFDESECHDVFPSPTDESIAKKRKTSLLLGDINSVVADSLPSPREESVGSEPVSMNTLVDEEGLKEAWIATAGTLLDRLTKSDIMNMCQNVFIGISIKNVNEVWDKYSLDDASILSYEEFYKSLQSSRSSFTEVNCEEELQKESSLSSIDMSQKGFVSGATLIEHWESAGVPGSSQLLHDLGYTISDQVNVSALIRIMESELLTLKRADKLSKNVTVHVALLDANLVLQKLHVLCLRSTIEHMVAEREKLKSDVLEANQRALLLAQEVDDHHSNLEKSTQAQVKILEHRHAEQVRELTNQMKLEQEQISNHNAILEQKLSTMQAEECNYKTLITQLQTENTCLEHEHRNVVELLNKSEEVRKTLEIDLESLSGLQEKLNELEGSRNEEEINLLMEKIKLLEDKNTNLRDRNDELTMEVEDLTSKLANTSLKKASSPLASLNISMIDTFDSSNIFAGAMKRRGDSPLFLETTEYSSGDEDSPRLGKVRKCSEHVKDFALAAATSLEGLQIHPSSQIESEINNFSGESKESLVGFDVIPKLNTQVSFSEELKQMDLEELSSNECKLKQKIEQITKDISKLYKENCLCETCPQQVENLQQSSQIPELKSKILELENQIEENKNVYNKEKQSSEERCTHLEQSVELLKEEYEKTEDYWSGKLDEERNFFEQEQKLSDEKYAELLAKIMEYEEMLANEKMQEARLETIDERASLEKQVIDMEEEYEALKSNWELKLLSKDEEIKNLKEKLSRYEQNGRDAAVQVSEDTSAKTYTVDRASTSSTNPSSSSYKATSSCDSCNDDFPSSFLYQKHENKKQVASFHEPSKRAKSRAYYKRSQTFSPGDAKKNFYYNPSEQLAHITMLKEEVKSLQEAKLKFQQDCTSIAKERDLLYRDMLELQKQRNAYRSQGSYHAQQWNNYFIGQATGPIGNNPNMNGKLKYLEQRCHHLTVNFKKQQKQTEEIIKSSWQQHQNEVADLKSVLKMTEDKLKQQTQIIQEQLNKLSRTDMLVKDLFVENAYLLSAVQKMEHIQCVECNREKSLVK